jgi:hypothetical protein
MKHAALLSILVFAAACAGTGGGGSSTTSAPGHGAIAITISPNPIVATQVSGNTYDFPFEVIVRETGGRAVNISRVSADVYALGGIRIGTETYDTAKITSLGYSTSVPANGELRYRFNPRRTVTDERLFSAVSADVTVEGTDDAGTPTTARTTVSVRR